MSDYFLERGERGGGFVGGKRSERSNLGKRTDREEMERETDKEKMVKGNESFDPTYQAVGRGEPWKGESECRDNLFYRMHL